MATQLSDIKDILVKIHDLMVAGVPSKPKDEKAKKPEKKPEGNSFASIFQPLTSHYLPELAKIKDVFKSLPGLTKPMSWLQQKTSDFLWPKEKQSTPATPKSSKGTSLPNVPSGGANAGEAGEAAEGAAGAAGAAEGAAGLGEGLAALGAGIAALLGPVGLAVAGIAAFVVGLVMLPELLKGLGQAALDAQRHFAEVSGRMATVFANLDAQQMMSDIRVGDKTAGSAQDLANSQIELTKALEEQTSFFSNLKNEFLTMLNNALTTIAKIFEPIFKVLNDMLELMPGYKSEASEQPWFVDWLNSAGGFGGPPVRPSARPPVNGAMDMGMRAGEWLARQLGLA